jgi:LysM repeat protein
LANSSGVQNEGSIKSTTNAVETLKTTANSTVSKTKLTTDFVGRAGTKGSSANANINDTALVKGLANSCLCPLAYIQEIISSCVLAARMRSCWTNRF